jgi:hypothetical protein
MNCGKMKTLIGLGLISVGMLLSHGCAANGYITASVQSVLGLDVSENPQTQVPHIRFGYIRSQMYYLPTGKVRVDGGASGSASETPVLVSDIDVDAQFLQSIKIKERFAVGKEAVSTDAAKYLFLPTVESSKKFVPMESDSELRPLVLEIAKITTKDKKKREEAENWIKANYPEFEKEKYPFTRFLMHPPSKTALELLLHELKET